MMQPSFFLRWICMYLDNIADPIYLQERCTIIIISSVFIDNILNVNLSCWMERFITATNKNPSISDILSLFGGTIVQMNRRPSVWCSKYYFFFHDFLKNSLQKSFQFVFLLFHKITKSFEFPKSIRNDEKINAWNIRRLVDESFVPATQWTTVL